MADIASVLKAELARIARKEVRAQTLAFKKASALHRSGIASLRKQIDTLERQLKTSKNQRVAQPARARLSRTRASDCVFAPAASRRCARSSTSPCRHGQA